MTSHILWCAFAFPTLAIAGFIAGVAPTVAAGPMNINVVERGVAETVLDTGDKGDSVGDLLIFTNKVYDEANKVQVGTDSGFCTRTVPGKAWECVFSVSLADGNISNEGTFIDGQDSVYSVTGGTGKYMNARGEMHLHIRNKEGTENDLKYSLTQ
jgi:allene oxide cyclase